MKNAKVNDSHSFVDYDTIYQKGQEINPTTQGNNNNNNKK